MLEDAELYSQYHNLQVRDAHTLLDRILPEMSFEDEDVIMDVGCGPGDNTKNILLPRLPKLKKIIAMDVIPKMIEFAKTRMTDEKIEYHVADIEDKAFLKLWEASISKIFSVHCFHWVKNQRKGFESLYDLLKPNGEAVLLFMLSAKPWNCYPALVNDVKWNKYLKDADQRVPESHHLNHGAEHFRKVFEDLGFQVLLCEDEERTFSYNDDDECKAAWKSRSALTSYIPEEHRKDFIEDLFKGFLKFSPRNSEGLPTLYSTVLTVILRKP